MGIIAAADAASKSSSSSLTFPILIVLVFVGVPLQVAGHPGVATVVGTLHGFLYIIYLFVAFQLTRTMHIPLFRTVLVLIAGTVPFGAIIAERRLTSEYSRQVRRAAKGAGTGSVFGFVYSGDDLGSATALLLYGVLGDHHAWRAVFFACAAAYAAAVPTLPLVNRSGAEPARAPA